MDIDDYQVTAAETVQFKLGEDQSKMISILGLSGEVGELSTEYKKKFRDGDNYKLFKDKLVEELGDIFWYLSAIATQEDILLSEVAESNLKKTSERWKDLYPKGQLGLYQHHLDDGYKEEEQFPREFVVEFKECVRENDKQFVVIEVNGEKVGDDLRDNAHDDDFYRYHDIFHFSYVVVLGWSPVLRKFLNCKRKCDAQVDEIEDGGRAKVIDEAVSALVFNYAEQHNYFEGAGGVDYSLLRIIKNLTKHLEVNICTTKQWEDAILLGFDIWRKLRKYKQGRIICDMNAKSMLFEEIN